MNDPFQTGTVALWAARAERFHAHLDKCVQCRDHPFDLCPLGARILTTGTTAPTL